MSILGNKPIGKLIGIGMVVVIIFLTGFFVKDCQTGFIRNGKPTVEQGE